MSSDDIERTLRHFTPRPAPASLRHRALARPSNAPNAWWCNRRVAVGFTLAWLLIICLRLDTPQPSDPPHAFPALTRLWQSQLAMAHAWLASPSDSAMADALTAPYPTPKL